MIFVALAIINTLKSADLVAKKDGGNLKYYNKYQMNHGEAIAPNPKVTLKNVHEDERQSRQQAYTIQDDIKNLSNQAENRVKKLDHKKAKLEKKVVYQEGKEHTLDTIADQKEESIKEQINHDEKFKELYLKRGRENKGRYELDSPDLKPADAKLANFDQERVKNFRKAELKQNKQLNKSKKHDLEKKAKLMKMIAHLEARIGAIDTDIKNLEIKTEFRVAVLEHKEQFVDRHIEADQEILLKRKDTEQVESTEANQ